MGVGDLISNGLLWKLRGHFLMLSHTITFFSVEGIELDLRMRNFEFFNLVSSYTFDSLRPIHLKATGKVNKYYGDQVSQSSTNSEMIPKEDEKSISGDISISALKLNQLMLALQLAGVLNISSKGMKVCLTSIFLGNSYLRLIMFYVPNFQDFLKNVTNLCSLQKPKLLWKVWFMFCLR